MVQSRKKRKDKKKLLGNHQKSWIWGRHAVLEILDAGRWPMKKLFKVKLDLKKLFKTKLNGGLWYNVFAAVSANDQIFISV